MSEIDKPSIDTPVDNPRSNTVVIRAEKGVSKANKLARVALSPQFGAVTALGLMNEKNGLQRDVETSALFDELMAATQDNAATGTDRLMTQAIVLDKLFTHLTALSMRQKYVSSVAPTLNLALKAQAQCRATLQAISDIRHPRQYVGTQNVREQYNAGGHVQVNRGNAGDRTDRGGESGRDVGSDDACGAKNGNQPNELTEGSTP